MIYEAGSAKYHDHLMTVVREGERPCYMSKQFSGERSAGFGFVRLVYCWFSGIGGKQM